jgi:hypothetical protein
MSLHSKTRPLAAPGDPAGFSVVCTNRPLPRRAHRMPFPVSARRARISSANEEGSFLAQAILRQGEEVRFASDSSLEGDGFELPVPRELISAGGRNPAASGSTSALDGATRAQLGGAERTVARKWRKTGFSRRFAMRRA